MPEELPAEQRANEKVEEQDSGPGFGGRLASYGRQLILGVTGIRDLKQRRNGRC